MQKIILASSSPRRREILKILGINFEVIPSNFEEKIKKGLSPEKIVETLAHGKALDILSKYHDAIIIWADTICVFENKIIGKPKDLAHAEKMIYSYSNKAMDVFTWICVIKDERVINYVEEATIYFGEISKQEAKDFVNKTNPLDKAGGFGIQELGGILVKRIDGDYYNIVWLPLFGLYNILKNLWVKIL